MKRPFSLMLAVLALLTLCVPVFADNHDGFDTERMPSPIQAIGTEVVDEDQPFAPSKDFSYGQGTIIGSRVNIRVAASTAAVKLATLSKGDRIVVIDETNGWQHILWNNSDAFVASKYVALLTEAEANTYPLPDAWKKMARPSTPAIPKP